MIYVNITQIRLLQKNNEQYQLCYILHYFNISTKVRICEHKKTSQTNMHTQEVKVCICYQMMHQGHLMISTTFQNHSTSSLHEQDIKRIWSFHAKNYRDRVNVYKNSHLKYVTEFVCSTGT
jgi:hypothetical protein